MLRVWLLTFLCGFSVIGLEYNTLNRTAKFFPLFSVVRFANSQCMANNNLKGTCFTRRECSQYGGTPSGTCANGHGICCVFQKTCGSTTNVNNTYFTNPEYPTTFEGGERCTITVNKCNSDICQLRLDFLELSLAQPNGSGVCDYDLLLVSGSSTSVPRICGHNANQHVYVEFNGASPITISIDTNAGYTTDRRWHIRIQQLACDSICKAPNGCLQYYKSVSDTVSSFNYGASLNPRDFGVGTRQMVNTNYGICVRMALGYCAIEWSQSSSGSFSVSGDPNGIDPSIINSDEVALNGTNCKTDFVIIPHPFQGGVAVGADRFCGVRFATKISYSKPFVLYTITDESEGRDGAEDRDVQNRGFSLTYRQIPCAPI